jgi:hypothetical protein
LLLVVAPTQSLKIVTTTLDAKQGMLHHLGGELENKLNEVPSSSFALACFRKLPELFPKHVHAR